MNDILMILLKISLVIFMAGNLLDMGLRLNPQDALRGLRNFRFVVYTLLWGFVLCPTLAYAITRVIPLESHYGIGLILMGMTPSAPFLPAIVNKAKGDLGFTAAFMLLTAAGTVGFMPFAVPVMVQGLTVSAWTIAKPLLLVVLLPLAVGMATRNCGAALAPLLSMAESDQRGIVMVVLGIPMMAIFGFLAAKWFGRPAGTDEPGVAPSGPM